MFILDPQLRPAKKRTGCKLSRARAGTQSCAFTGRLSPGSTRVGGRARSNSSLDVPKVPPAGHPPVSEKPQQKPDWLERIAHPAPLSQTLTKRGFSRCRYTLAIASRTTGSTATGSRQAAALPPRSPGSRVKSVHELSAAVYDLSAIVYCI